MTDFPNLIETREAARIIFGSPDRKNYYRVYDMIKAGDIKAKKLGDRWFIPGAEMARFLKDFGCTVE